MRRRYRVEGRVQGVGFRWFAAREAKRLGLRGWVRNLADGAVEAEAAGDAGALAAFETALRSGPRTSNVTNVEISEISDEANAVSGFTIIG